MNNTKKRRTTSLKGLNNKTISKEKAPNMSSPGNITRCIAFLSCCLLIASCSTETKEQTQATTTGMTVPAKDSLSTITQAPASAETKTPDSFCDCTPVKEYNFNSQGLALHYSSNEQDKDEQDSILNRHLHDPASLKTKVLQLSTNGALPPEIKAFKNVEHIILMGRLNQDALKSFDLFPKLISVVFYGGEIELDTTQGWMKRVENLSLFKCKVKGLASFKQTPRLKYLTIGHSGFEYFPKDFNALSCLQELNIEEYKFGKDHPRLEEIDLRNFACLKTFRVWGGASGLPQGLDSIKKIELTLRPWAMNDAELKIYKAWKKRIKNAG